MRGGGFLCVTGGLLLLCHGYGDGGAGSISLLSLPLSFDYRLAALSVLIPSSH